VIIDRTGGAMQYLDFIASLSYEFLGDVMFVRADGSAYLSSVGRGGGRATVLEMHASLTPPAVGRQIA
jgi:hypothetical protein